MSEDKASPAPIKPPASFKKRTAPKKPRKISETYLHNAGLYYLQRFATSSTHFRRVMTRKIQRSCMAHPEQDQSSCLALLEGLVIRFQASGLLDDDNYLRARVSSLRRKGCSHGAIMQQMRAKGFADAVIRAALQAQDCDCDTQSAGEAELIAALKHARRKRLGAFAHAPQADIKKSLSNFSRKGFSFDTARRVLDMDLAQAQEILALERL